MATRDIPEVDKEDLVEGVDYVKPTDEETTTRIFVDYEEARDYFNEVRAVGLQVHLEDIGAEGFPNQQEPHWYTGELEEDEMPPDFRYAVYLDEGQPPAP